MAHHPTVIRMGKLENDFLKKELTNRKSRARLEMSVYKYIYKLISATGYKSISSSDCE